MKLRLRRRIQRGCRGTEADDPGCRAEVLWARDGRLGCRSCRRRLRQQSGGLGWQIERSPVTPSHRCCPRPTITPDLTIVRSATVCISSLLGSHLSSPLSLSPFLPPPPPPPPSPSPPPTPPRPRRASARAGPPMPVTSRSQKAEAKYNVTTECPFLLRLLSSFVLLFCDPSHYFPLISPPSRPPLCRSYWQHWSCQVRPEPRPTHQLRP